MHLIHDTVIPDSEFPVALQSLSERSPIARRGIGQPCLDCSGDPVLKILRDLRKVLFGDVRVVEEREGQLNVLAA
jgi:hypothetical protein